MSKKRLADLLLIILVCGVLRIPSFFYSYVNIDETDYSLAARTILGGGIPYRDFLIYQPPLIYYLYALGAAFAGWSELWAIRIITIGFVAGTSLSIYFLLQLLTNSRRASPGRAPLFGALAYAVFSTTFIPQDMLAANCEILMMLPTALSALFLLQAEHFEKKTLYFLSGVFIGLAVLTKYQGGIMLVAALVYLLILRRYAITSSLLVLTGFFAPILLVLAYFYQKNALSYVYEAFAYILLYAKGPAQSDFLYVFLKFIVRSVLFCLPSLPLWIGSLYIFRLKKPALPPFVSFLTLWFILSVAPIIMGGRIYFHYYIIILPVAAVFAGMWWNLKGAVISRGWKFSMLAWGVICVLGWEVYAVSLPLRPPKQKETWVKTASYLKDIAKEGDTLFVWGLCYQLYFFSGMDLATRFTSADYLTGRSPMTAGLEYDPKTPNPPSSMRKLWNDFADKPGIVHFDTSDNIFPKAWEYFEEDVSKGLPAYIVDTSKSNYRRYARYPANNYPFLNNLIEKNYRPLNEIDGFVIYKRN
jgi:4-amino-4-deoxy-L-arabinose transferase-like glycosyltransferase